MMLLGGKIIYSNNLWNTMVKADSKIEILGIGQEIYGRQTNRFTLEPEIETVNR